MNVVCSQALGPHAALNRCNKACIKIDQNVIAMNIYKISWDNESIVCNNDYTIKLGYTLPLVYYIYIELYIATLTSKF